MAAPFLLGRAGGYFYWLLGGRRKGDPIYWREYGKLKPEGYWITFGVLWSVQFMWIGLLLVAVRIFDLPLDWLGIRIMH